MSRYDQPSEPDLDRYEAKPVEDIDVPDFDAPEPEVDPAEVAAYALLTSLHAFELEVVQTGELDRAQLLKKLSKQAFDVMNRIDLKASAKIDEILERRR